MWLANGVISSEAREFAPSSALIWSCRKFPSVIAERPYQLQLKRQPPPTLTLPIRGASEADLRVCPSHKSEFPLQQLRHQCPILCLRSAPSRQLLSHRRTVPKRPAAFHGIQVLYPCED